MIVSFETSVSAVKSASFDSTFQAALRRWQSSGHQVWWAWKHEADNPSNGVHAADFVAGYKHLLAIEAKVSHSNLHSMTILEGYLLYPSHPHGSPESWYVAGVDALGFDTYYVDALKRAQAYAEGKGKRLAIPEFGNTVTTTTSDDATLRFAKEFVAALHANTFAICWYNNRHNSLTNRPKTLAYLRSIA